MAEGSSTDGWQERPAYLVSDEDLLSNQRYRITPWITSHCQQVDGDFVGQALPPAFVRGQAEHRKVVVQSLRVVGDGKQAAGGRRDAALPHHHALVVERVVNGGGSAGGQPAYVDRLDLALRPVNEPGPRPIKMDFISVNFSFFVFRAPSMRGIKFSECLK